MKLLGKYLTILEQGESFLRVIDLESEVETTLPYRKLKGFREGGNLYGVETDEDMRILRAHDPEDLTVDWQLNMTGLPMYYPQKNEDGLLYILGGLDSSWNRLQVTVLNENDGTAVRKWQMDEYAGIEDLGGSIMDTDGFFYYRTDRTGWSGYVSRNDRCSGEELWGMEVLSVGYTRFFKGQELLVRFNVGPYVVMDKKTGSVLAEIDNPVSGYFPIIYTVPD